MFGNIFVGGFLVGDVFGFVFFVLEWVDEGVDIVGFLVGMWWFGEYGKVGWGCWIVDGVVLVVEGGGCEFVVGV